ncbi:MAG: ABC transporter permease [Saccharofermentans sp.]|nr:ABC transporter permease [Saccharofermentans sp.]
MGGILFKRTLRDLKAGAARYIALSLLIIFSLYLVISLMGAAYTIIDNSERSDKELVTEDGEFTVFVPLTDEEINELTQKGITVEEMFSTDYRLNSDQVLRAFKVRTHIDQIGLVRGELPKTDSEAVLERRFAEENGYEVGDTIELAGQTLTICGIGATADYNNVVRNLSDSVVSSKAFGTIFVMPDTYDQMLSSGNAIASEEYNYAYLLNGAMTDNELRTILEENEFDLRDVRDEYFLDYWEEMTGRKDELLEGIDELSDGANELADGAEELDDGVNEFSDGITELRDNMPDLVDGTSELDDGAGELEDGIRAYTSGVNEAATGASTLSEGASQIAQGASTLNSGAQEYTAGLSQFSNSVTAMTQSQDPYMAGVAASLKDPVDSLNSGFAQISGGISELSNGSAELQNGAAALSDGLGTLSDNSSALVSGANALHDGTSELADAAIELSDGVDELYDGSEELRDGTGELADGARELADGVSEFSDEANDLIDEVFNIKTRNLRMFLPVCDNPRIGAAADDVVNTLSASIIFGILLVMLFAYVISVFVVHNIDSDSAVIGALYSMGLKRRTLTLSYVAIPVLVCFVSGVIGLLVATLTPFGIAMQMQDTLSYYSMPDVKVTLSPVLYVYGLVVPPVTAFIVNVLVIRSRLKKTPLALLKNERKVSRGKDLKIKRLKFIDMFRIRQMLREGRSALTVLFGLFLCLLIAFLAIEVNVYCSRVKTDFVDYTNFEYMYTYKYPTEEVPEGGYEAVVESFKKEIYGYSFDVAVVGITEDNPFFDTGDLPDNNTDVVIGSAMAYKYDLEVGDEFTLEDSSNDRLYAFRVERIVDFAASFMIFMDIDECRELFGEDDDYFNAVFSDHALDIDSGRLYSTLSKSDIEKTAGIFVNQMSAMIIAMSVTPAVIFVVVLYLMLKMMLDRSSFNISLVKIFGFRNKEVRQMYLDGNFYIVALGSLIAIPLCKAIMDYIYPRYMVNNVGVGVDSSYSMSMYAVIFAVILILYLIISSVLVGRIKKIDPTEVLKNRE